jgi:acetyltransferase-like isoleucine patch superfamily enzyme
LSKVFNAGELDVSRLKKIFSSLLSKYLDAYLEEFLKKNLPTQYLVLEDNSQIKLDDYLKEYLRKNLPIQYLVFGDASRLKIAKTAIVNNALFNLSSGDITIGDYAFFGHNVTVLTGTHDYEKLDKERQVSIPISGRNVLIERGAWIASNATILAPCTIGEHAVVAAGALVNKDVPPYAIVAGVPAKIIREIKRNQIPSLIEVADEKLYLS